MNSGAKERWFGFANISLCRPAGQTQNCKMSLIKKIAIQQRKLLLDENSKIEWTDHTFNAWLGCQKVSPGCDHCYAEAMMDHRYGKVTWGPHGKRVRTSDNNWKTPVKWNSEAEAFKREYGRRPRVFCASAADVFDNKVPSAWRGDLFTLIRECDRLDWLLLTKRPQNILRMLPFQLGRRLSERLARNISGKSNLLRPQVEISAESACAYRIHFL